jgi:hypothetical protein
LKRVGISDYKRTYLYETKRTFGCVAGIRDEFHYDKLTLGKFREYRLRNSECRDARRGFDSSPTRATMIDDVESLYFLGQFERVER